MKRAVCLVFIWLSMAAAAWAFILPWAHLDMKQAGLVKRVRETIPTDTLQGLAGKLTNKVSKVVVTVKHGAETVTGELPDLSNLPGHVSGMDIPQVANRKDMMAAMALTELFTGQQELGAKAYLVYVVPGLALLCGLITTLNHRMRMLDAMIGLMCVAIGAAGLWTLSTVKTDTLVVAIRIGRGLWLSCWAYVALGASALALSTTTRSH